MNDLRAAPASGASPAVFVCGRTALWMPRVLAGAVLVSGMLAAFRVDGYAELQFSSGLLATVVVFSAFLAIWILRAGAEVRLRVRFDGGLVLFEIGNSATGVTFANLDRFEFEGPIGVSKRLFPATVLLDKDGKTWRLPVALDRGAELIRQIVLRSGRSDLEAWADTLHLERRMRRGVWFTRGGYLVATLSLAAAAWFYVH